MCGLIAPGCVGKAGHPGSCGGRASLTCKAEPEVDKKTPRHAAALSKQTWHQVDKAIWRWFDEWNSPTGGDESPVFHSKP